MKIKYFTFFVLFIAFNAAVNSQVSTHPQSPQPMSKNPLLPYPDTVHNMALLSHYKVFSGNAVIKHAFMVSPAQLEVSLNEPDIPDNAPVVIKSYNYDSTDAGGHFATITEFQPTYTRYNNKLIFKNIAFDLRKNYIIELQGTTANIYLDPTPRGVIDSCFNAYDINGFGVTYAGANATFRLWSPPAGKIELFIFDKNQQLIKTNKPLLLSHTGKGVWELTVKPTDLKGISSLDGLFYQYKVYAYGEARMALDPYAFSMAASDSTVADPIGKGAIINMNDLKAKPAVFSKTYANGKAMANEADMVAYEVHIRDFTVQPDVFEPPVAGTFKGFTSKTDYLKSMGITHVQLMPVQNFYTVNETDREYRSGTAIVSNYNWGYDPHNYFTPEGWFSTNARNPYVRVREFREMIQSLHTRNIGVIMDVVYNHAYIAETFENIAPGCYHRFDENYALSGKTGAGPGLESRHIMVRKLIIESLKHFVKEYHVDGFRFDLMGFLDHATMLAIRDEVGKAYNPANPNELILQGEAWLFSDLSLDIKSAPADAATTKINYPRQKLNTGIFNDASRDSYTGRGFEKGFVQGVFKEYDRVATGIAGGLKTYDAGNKIINTEIFNDSYNRFAETPATCLNYLSIHDGFTLWDKLNLSVKDPSKTERARLMRLASAMLFTSQGKIILHGGDEMLRTKPLSANDKERNRAHTTPFTDEEEGVVYFHENTYCSNDYTNMFRWDRLTNEYYEFSSPMVDYYKGLILMRRQLPCLRYNKAENVNKGLIFLCGNRQNGAQPLYKGFNDEKLDTLEITFINGPKYERYYVAGEVYPVNTSPNGENNEMYFVDFDGNGTGSILFTKQQIQSFDLTKWGEPNTLNVKLIKTPGQWDALPKAYTGMGNNAIRPGGIDEEGHVAIDLSVTDFEAGAVPRKYDSYIAYHLDNTLEKDLPKGFTGAPFTELIVVHNAGENEVSVATEYIGEPAGWVVICDSYNAGIKPLKYSALPTTKKGETNVLIEQGKVAVPRKSTAVIARIK